MRKLLLTVFAFSAATACIAQESVCARVKIEIKQELSLERQAFDAEMRITNSLPVTSLTDVGVDVKVTDEMGNAVRVSADPNDLTAAFFIRQTQRENIDNTTGTGQVAPQATAVINWLLIPAAGAAGNNPLGKRYLVGATLRYTFGSEAQVMQINPDAILVKPLPQLTLDYFLTRDVIGDDPFTAAIEAPEPYTLGVRVANSGVAAAKSLKINSAQPQIRDNQQGLPITYQILGSYVQDLPASNSLLIDFGDIAAHASKMGRWQMQSNIAGRFTDFSATFTHSDELGGALTSLLLATNAHFLVHDVRVDLPGRDYVRDFLSVDGTEFKIFESEGADSAVADLSAQAALSADGAGYRLSLPPASGFLYVRKPDPYQGQKVLGPVMRSDAKAMAVENVWLSKTQNPNTHLWDYWFNVFDVNSTGDYAVEFKDATGQPQPPAIQFIPDRSVAEGQQIGFLVEATSPTGLAVHLGATPLPSGASFHDQGDGTAVFDWVPATGQAGVYLITYSATDGQRTSTRAAKITVTTAEPPPGPAVPEIAHPLQGAELVIQRPTFQARTSAQANDPTVSVVFEVYSDAGMTDLFGRGIVARNPVPDQPTTWTADRDFEDNAHYYWRARAVAAGDIYSEWASADFRVNVYNDPPDIFNLTLPAPGASVDSLTPLLALTNAGDRDGDVLTYGFEVFSDAALLDRVAWVDALPAGEEGQTRWTVSLPLVNHATYYWRAQATDTHGASTQSAVRSFKVDTGNASPDSPVPVGPIGGVDVTTAQQATLVVNNSQDADMDTLTYRFQIDTVDTFDSENRRDSDPVPAGSNGRTAWTVTGLQENQRYYWRAKAQDSRSESEWSFGAFRLNAVNEAPGVPTIANPGTRAWVATRTPVFDLQATTDPEGDAIVYRFEVYSDAALQQLEASGTSATTSWQSGPLRDKATHYWRAKAQDVAGAEGAWTETTVLFVSTGTYVTPSISLSAPSGTLDARDGDPSIAWEGRDPNIEPTIALYYDHAGSGFVGTRIADGLRQDAGTQAGSYVWNLAGLAPGAYYPFGVIYDDRGLGHAYAPGVVVVPTSPQQGSVVATAGGSMSLREGRDSATVSVRLGRAPVDTVVVPVSSNDTTEAYVTPAQLTFTAANWSTAQAVTVVAVADGVKDGNQPFAVQFGKATSRDPDFIGVVAPAVAGTVVDANTDSTAGLSMTSYQLVSKTYDSRAGLWTYHYKAVLTNVGPALKSVTADVASATGYGVVQGRLRYGAIGSNESVLSDKDIVLESGNDYGSTLPTITWTMKATQ